MPPRSVTGIQPDIDLRERSGIGKTKVRPQAGARNPETDQADPRRVGI